MSKEGKKKRHYLTLETRMKLYPEVLKLRKQGLSQRKIQRIIYEKHGVEISLSVINYWIRGKKHPFGKVNKFDEKPSPELSYIIGAIYGDGCKRFDGRVYYFRLAVNDKEFAKEFSKNLAKILGKNKPYKIFWSEYLKQWITQGYSILLYKFLKEKTFEELKIYIEYNKDCVSSFLRALFDGEGYIYKRKLRLYNTNKELLIYVKYLLEKYFNIETTGPRLKRKVGEITHFLNGKVVKYTKDYYSLYIRANSLLNFYKFVGFTIKRKQQRLLEAIKQ